MIPLLGQSTLDLIQEMLGREVIMVRNGTSLPAQKVSVAPDQNASRQEGGEDSQGASGALQYVLLAPLDADVEAGDLFQWEHSTQVSGYYNMKVVSVDRSTRAVAGFLQAYCAVLQ